LRARQQKIEDGSVVRVDSTATAALMHEPSDSGLLWDAVRVMLRLLKQAQRWTGDLARAWRDHSRAAKKRWQAITFTRGRPKRVPLYRALIMIVRKTLAYLRDAAARLTSSTHPAVALWRAKVRHYEPLIETVIAQSERRVLRGETVPARDKLVSLFETHADIIVKRRRNVRYGHKLNLTSGRTGLILDLVIEAGNPADSDRLMPMLERHIGTYGAAPRQAAADGGFASRDNLSRAKACDVRDMAFHKNCPPTNRAAPRRARSRTSSSNASI
jgi:IS5 family transposase